MIKEGTIDWVLKSCDLGGVGHVMSKGAASATKIKITQDKRFNMETLNCYIKHNFLFIFMESCLQIEVSIRNCLFQFLNFLQKSSEQLGCISVRNCDLYRS